MKETAKISISGLIGAGAVYFLIKKLPKSVAKPTEEEEKITYLQLPSIYLPANIDEWTIDEIIDKLKKPNITPLYSLSAFGWKVEWPPISVDLPITGQVNISPASRQLPPITYSEVTNYLKQFQPQAEKEALLWKISFPTIEIRYT